MNRYRVFASLSGLFLAFTAAADVQAHVHLWRFSEVFSNAEGSVQFIELRVNNSTNEFEFGGTQLRSTVTGNIFTFPNDVAGPTNNKRMLVATSSFASLAGSVTPDFTFPPDFFNPAGDTLRFCENNCASVFDTETIAAATPAPTDGVTSRAFTYANGTAFTEGANTPTNYAGNAGSVNANIPTGDYNGNLVVDADDFVLWRKTFGAPASPAGTNADGDKDGSIDDGDYDFWASKFGNPVAGAGTATGSAVPEPSVCSLFLIAFSAMAAMRRRER